MEFDLRVVNNQPVDFIFVPGYNIRFIRSKNVSGHLPRFNGLVYGAN